MNRRLVFLFTLFVSLGTAQTVCAQQDISRIFDSIQHGKSASGRTAPAQQASPSTEVAQPTEAVPPAQSDPPTLCAFDSLSFGKLENVEPLANGVRITLDMEVETLTQEITKSASFYPAVEEFLAKAKQADAPLEVAFLYKDNELCGFTSASYDQAYVQEYKKRDGRFILSVATDETDNTYTLKISPGNRLHSSAEKQLETALHKVIYVYFAPEGEILDFGLYQ